MNQNLSPDLQGAHLAIALVASTGLLPVTVSASAAQPSQLETLRIDDYRPLGRAIYELVARHGLLITYEDPRYVHESELTDVTEERRGTKEGPRIFGPGRGRLELSYPVVGGVPEDPAALLQDLIDQHAEEGNPGRFELRQYGDVLHVVPVLAMDEEGWITAQQPLMDLRISLARKERSVDEALKELVEALHRATGMGIIIGSRPFNFAAKPADVWAEEEPAREVMRRILDAAGDRLTWALYDQPMLSSYMLIVKLVRQRDLLLPDDFEHKNGEPLPEP